MSANSNNEVRCAPATPATALLERIGPSIEVGPIGPFVAAEKLQQGKVVDGVAVYWIGTNFEKDFFEKVGQPVDPATFYTYQLQKPATGIQIIRNIGKSGVESTSLGRLGQMWEMVKRQGQGQEGPLLINGSSNLFPLFDKSGVRRVVEAYWNVRFAGWGFGSRSARDPHEFGTDVLIISS